MGPDGQSGKSEMKELPETEHSVPLDWISGRERSPTGNVFLTGRAGTGKTTLLRKFLSDAGEQAIVLAPTGIAAMNVGGQTIHSFFKFPPRLLDGNDVKRLRNARLVRKLETIIIDEISMVRADMLDAIDRSLQFNRGSKKPFGGVRMVLSGDLHQLPPVVSREEEEILQERYGNPYFFCADAFRTGAFALVALKHVHRQSDPAFLKLLNGIRRARLDEDDVDVLNSRVTGRSSIEASATHIVLTPNNAAAFRINQARLNELDGQAHYFDAKIEGQFEEKAAPTESTLALKRGARVMLIKNDAEGRWVNGSIGQVEGFDDDAVMVSIDGDTYRIEPATWEKYRYELDRESEKVDRSVIGTFKQVPIRLAYAVTIHKSQGLTLDKVYIDFDHGMFAHGQAYVAFSRATSLEGLDLSRPLRPSDLVFDRRAFDFGSLNIVSDTEDFLIAGFQPGEDELL